MAGRLTRFLNLEKRRKAGDEPAHEVMTPGRFTPPAGAGHPAETPHGVVTPGRFEPPGLQLSPDHGEQPFLRCPSCEADDSRFAVRCSNCGTRLDTEAVRLFNEQLWAQRHAEAEASKVAEADHQKALAVDQRALGEAIAREVAEREQARLGGNSTPLGVRWLARLDESQRLPVAIGAVALFTVSALVALLATRHPLLRTLGFGTAVLLMSLFLPNRRRRFWD